MAPLQATSLFVVTEGVVWDLEEKERNNDFSVSSTFEKQQKKSREKGG